MSHAQPFQLMMGTLNPIRCKQKPIKECHHFEKWNCTTKHCVESWVIEQMTGNNMILTL